MAATLVLLATAAAVHAKQPAVAAEPAESAAAVPAVSAEEAARVAAELEVTAADLRSAQQPASRGKTAAKAAPVAPSGVPPVRVSSTGGSSTLQHYATLSDAFGAINLGTHQGSITIDILDNVTEASSAVLNHSGSGAASYTSVLIRPDGAPRTITGAITGAIIKLNGADNVTIDGRIGGSGRNLTVSNTSTAAATAAIWLASAGSGNGASNNIIRNLEISAGQTSNAGTAATFGIYMGGSTIAVAAADGFNNDNNSFVANRITRCRYGIVTRGVPTANSLGTIVTDNIIGPAAFGADQIGKAGIFMQADTRAVVSRNTVQFVGGPFAGTTAGADRCGICIGQENWTITDSTSLASGDYVVTRNVIHDVIDERTFSAMGIRLGTTRGGSSTNNLVANNFIYNVRGNGTAGDQTVGIGVSAGVGDRIVFNSISLTGDVDPAGASNSTQFGNGIRISSANSASNANLTIANNSIYMDLNSNTATLRYYAITAPSGAYSFGSGFLNHNNYYVVQANPQMRTGGFAAASGAAAATEFQTLMDWQAAFSPPQDANSIQADPQYVSITSDLHISPTSPNVDAGVSIAGVAKDIDGQLRVSPPDIGADEPGGTAPLANDLAAVAVLSPESGSVGPAGSTMPVQASFVNEGANTLTNVTVRFRILDANNMIVYNQTVVVPSIAPDEIVIVTFPNATLPAGNYTSQAVAELSGDQDPTNNTATGTFSLLNPLSGTVTVGSGGSYGSLTGTNGLFAIINDVGLSGHVTVNVMSDLTETGAVALNRWSESGAGGYTLKIQPTGAPRAITGAIASTGLLRFISVNGVTIDGSLDGAGTDRSLTIENTSTTSPTVVLFGSTGTTPVMNSALKNCNVRNGANTSSAVVISDSGTVGNPGFFSNITVQNNNVQRAFVGVYANGGSGGPPLVQNGSNLMYLDNDVNSTGTNAVRIIGLYMQGVNGALVARNRVGNLSGTEAEVDRAMWIASGTSNVTVDGNYISGMNYTGTAAWASQGIAVSALNTNSNITLRNNMITDVSGLGNSYTGTAFGQNPFGIYVFSAMSGVNIHANSIHLFQSRLNQTNALSAGIAVASTANGIEVINNNIVNRHGLQGATGYGAVGIWLQGAASQLTAASNNNYLVDPPGGGVKAVGQIATAPSNTVPEWQAATGRETGTLSVDPLFLSSTNLHLNCGSPVTAMGTPLASVTTDFDGQARDATPDIGADERYAPTALGAVSRKVHGGAGTFDIPLPGVEPRGGTGDHQIVFTFAAPVTFSGATMSGTGTVASSSGSGTNTVTVNLSGVADAQRITLTLQCASDGTNSGDVAVQMGVLLGDTNGNGIVNTSDIGQTKAQSGATLTGANFRSDVNANGSITSTDIGIVKARSGNQLPPP